MRKIILIWAIGLLSCSAWTLSIVELRPTFSTRIAKVSDHVIAVFDSSLNVSTVNSANFKVRRLSDDSLVSGTLVVSTTNVENDTISVAPSSPWFFGEQYRTEITSGLKGADGTSFDGTLPHNGLFVPNIPNDFDIYPYDPADPFSCIGRTSALWGFNPADPENTDDFEPWTVPGMFVTEAWKYGTGSHEVLIAVIDDGITSFDARDVLENFFLNRGELPTPEKDGVPCDYDCDGNGKFNVLDYRWDERVVPVGILDPGDLIAAFANEIDDDQNGLVDDICGWDFFANSPYPLGDARIAEGDHGGGIANGCCAQANNRIGDRPGICPNCSVLPIRMSPTILSDFHAVAEAVRYANSMGAQIASAATGSFQHSHKSEDMILSALENGTIVISPVGDQLGFEPLNPAASSGVVGMNALMMIPPFELFDIIPLEEIAGFTESFCTNYGPQNEYAVPSFYYCTSDAVGLIAGVFGLAQSTALESGYEISAAQTSSLLQMTVDDVAKHCFSILELGAACREGWDIHFGYGRPNSKRACARAVEDKAPLPPGIIVKNPRKYDYFDVLKTQVADVEAVIEGDCSFEYVVDVARGADPLEEEFVTMGGGFGSGKISGKIASLNFEVLENPWDGSFLAQTPWDGFFTLRVSASCLGTDEKAYARVPIIVRYNHDSVCGFPLELGSSATSPALVDIDGDGFLEVIVATFDGEVHVIGYDEESNCWALRDGFPVELPYVNGMPQSIYSSAAVGDLDGDGYPEIVCSTMAGRIYVVRGDGNLHTDEDGDPAPFFDGFPVSADPRPADDIWLGNGFQGSPVLADLDADGALEIIVGGFDQKVYVWKSTDSDGDGFADRLDGWPVEAKSVQGIVPSDAYCNYSLDEPSPVVGTVAVGICDPDSEDPDISARPCVIVATTEICEESFLFSGRVYAFYWDGMNYSGVKVLPGWPAKPASPLGEAVPIPGYGQGIASSPVAAWAKKRLNVGIGGAGWFPQMIFYKDEVVSSIPLNSTLGLSLMTSGAFGDMDSDFIPDYAFLVTRFGRLDGQNKSPLNPRIMAWEGPNFMRKILDTPLEDLAFNYSPSIADLDGDGKREVLAGSGGMILHAYRTGGSEISGWPKQLGHWIMSTPAVADIDGDGTLEVVATTQKGVIFAFKTNAPCCTPDEVHASDWWTYQHDERRTGFYGTDTRAPSKIRDLTVELTKKKKFVFEFTSPGDDHACGKVDTFEVAAADEKSELKSPLDFKEHVVQTIKLEKLISGGDRARFKVELSGGLKNSWFSVRALDDAGNYGYPSSPVEVKVDKEIELDSKEVFCGCGG